MSSFFPFWTNATVAHESQQHYHPFSFPKASVHINDIFCTDTAAKMHGEKGDDAWETIVLSNYMIDFEWLCQTVPSLATVQKHLIVLSGEKGTATVRVVESSTGDGDSSCKKVFRYRSIPTSQDRGNSMLLEAIEGGIPREKIVILEPQLPYPYGTHHSKFVLAINDHGIRVVICTANFIHSDWANKTQGIYIQDFPRKSDGFNYKDGESTGLGVSESPLDDYQLRKGEDFRSYLQLYLAQLGLLPRVCGSEPILSFSPQDLDAFNFSSAKVWLFGSVPGSHRGKRLMSFGMNRLFSVLANVNLYSEAVPTNITSLKEIQPLVLSWQYSSQGLLNVKFLKAMQCCMTVPGSLVYDLQVIYPSEDEVRRSLEGWRGGISLPVHLRCCDIFINARLYRWGSSRGALSSVAELWNYVLPHIKSYAALDRARCHVIWFALTSANLSQAAWGSGTPAGRAKDSLFIRSYELGVLYDAYSQVAEHETWFSVTPRRPLPRPTTAVASPYLFPTPIAGVTASCLYLPYDILHPLTYDSTTELRQRERDNGMTESVPVNSEDKPWVVDIFHCGRDSINRTPEEAVHGFSHYGLTSWMAPVRGEFPWGSPRPGIKRPRLGE